MAAPAKSFTIIADTSVDPDSPLDTTLMTALRDNDLHLEEWLGKNYTAAVDHNHDGTNSAAIETGLIAKNGSFEGSGGWTYTDYTGGSHDETSTTGDSHGAQCLAITSTVLANGGGYAEKDEFWAVGSDKFYSLQIYSHASVANVSSRIEIMWYDSSQSLLTTDTLLDLTDTPTGITRYHFNPQATTNARYAKIRITGGVPAAGSATGTVYFDGISFNEVGTGWVKIASSGDLNGVSVADFTLDSNSYAHFMIKVRDIVSSSGAPDLGVRISQDGGSTFKTGAGNYAYAGAYLNNAGAWTADGSAGNTYIKIANNYIGATYEISGEVYLYNIDGPNSPIKYSMTMSGTSATIIHWEGAGRYDADTNAFDAIRFYNTITTWNSGVIELWGLPND